MSLDGNRKRANFPLHFAEKRFVPFPKKSFTYFFSELFLRSKSWTFATSHM